MQQSNSSVGCGAFTVENSIRGLDITSDIGFLNEIYDEGSIRNYHYELLEKYKDQPMFTAIDTLKEHGINFIDTDNILYSIGIRTTTLRGGRRENESDSLEEIGGNNTGIESKENHPLFQKSYNVVYQLISDYEYLFVPISGAIAGGIKWGPWGIAIGSALGVVDETLIYFGYAERRHLTWTIFGIATGHVIKPSKVITIVGAVIGVLLPTGVLNDYQELIAPTVSAVAGNSVSGVRGLVKGGVAGTLDEIVIYSGITDKHYLTFCSIGIAVINLVGWLHPVPRIANSVGIVLGLIAATYEKEIVTVWVPIKITKDLYATYNELLPSEQLNFHIEKQALVLIGSQFIIQCLSLKLTEYEQGLAYSFERFDVRNGPEWGNFRSKIIRSAIFVFPYIVGQAFSSIVNSYFNARLNFITEDKFRAKWLAEETALRLSQDSDSIVLIDNLRTNIFTMANSGNKLITSTISACIEGVYGFGIIIAGAPDILVYSTVYSQLCSSVSEYFASQQRNYEEQIKIYESKLANIVKHDSKNIRTITERDGIEFTQKKLQKVNDILRAYEISKNLWKEAGDIWQFSLAVTDSIFNYYLVSYKLNFGTLVFENRNKVQIASKQISSLLSWSGRHAVEIASVYQSLDRINTLLGKIHTDQVIPDYIVRTFRDGNKLILQDLEVKIGDKLLVAINHLEFEFGKRFAITGESGSGKTSLLSKIKGIKANGIGGNGYIYYPLINGKKPKIVMISQQDYFPIDSSLFEIIYYPNEISSDLGLHNEEETKVQSLLREIEFKIDDAAITVFNNITAIENITVSGNENTLDLNSIKDWYTVLSGGEKKKVLIVSAIFKKPNILILDEIFNGLDSKSIITAQQMFKKYLPNALMLVVDHHAMDNNYNFYDAEIHFSNKTVIVRSIVDASTKNH